jgi:transcriptional regulator with XRE-family HTH domain
MEFDVGARLRAVREMHDLSQRALAKRAGVTNGTISHIEQNRVSPSIGSLRKVLQGIPMSLSDFFAMEEVPRQKVFFAADDLLEIGDETISYRQVGHDLAERGLQIIHERYRPGADTGKTLLRHEAEEGGVVIRGQLEITVGDQRRVLGPGEAYYFDSRLPHRFRNIGDEECEVVSASTPPSF